MPNIEPVQQRHQPTIQLPVYAHPDLPLERIRGFIYIPTADGRGIERLIERREVRYGEELAFDTAERGANVEFQIMGIRIVDGQEKIVAGRRGYAHELDALDALHLV